jgi:hypothetical protein
MLFGSAFYLNLMLVYAIEHRVVPPNYRKQKKVTDYNVIVKNDNPPSSMSNEN